LAGRLEVAFGNEREALAPGDVFVIEAGDAHLARVIKGPVRLFLVEDPEDTPRSSPVD
jgi:quercetin dioxygenase-like cupin family protein